MLFLFCSKLDMEKLGARVNKIESTLTTVISKLHDLSGSVASGFEKIDKNFGIVIGRLGNVEARLDAIEISLKEIRGNSTVSLETVEEKITGLTTEISKINEVTNYKGQFGNLEVVRK